MSISYIDCDKSWLTYKKGKKIKQYSINIFGKYAKRLAEMTDETGIKYNNYYEIDGDTVTMIIYSKKHDKYYECLLDLEDLDKVVPYRWSIKRDPRANYCKTNTDKMLLHRLITNCPEDKVVDHINKNGLDNRRKNLRVVTQSKNLRNLDKRENASKIWIGVSYLERANGYMVRWRDNNSKVISKFYSANKYGDDDTAKHKAILKSIKMRIKYGYALDDKDIKYIKKHKIIFKTK